MKKVLFLFAIISVVRLQAQNADLGINQGSFSSDNNTIAGTYDNFLDTVTTIQYDVQLFNYSQTIFNGSFELKAKKNNGPVVSKLFSNVSISGGQSFLGTINDVATSANGYVIGDNTVVIWPSLISGNANTRSDSIEFHINLSDKSVIGVRKYEKNKIVKLYPNPATNVINIKYNNMENEITNIMVYDILGRTIYESKSAEAINTIAFTNGTYKLSVVFKNNYTENHLIMVAK